ncbi:hypothetical protein PC9H_003243 [Pleurotus ostreatus]|uniref:mitogen-activated protein kinase kinase kinase n=1 Tax=Pleurotus ostreatus TaxID=5322 RepID=A0A8H7A5H7_PLEOS|nr:uncharacterized protein PC9H_003243 [Pleurotus ostreatus]KAF7436410.1 hypothetical protein PC9H_003243 [Pleurotus ostreatus]
MEVLTAVTVPQVLKVAYDALLFSWTQYEKVEGNQTQCRLLIQRCQDLFFEVNKQLSDLGLMGKTARKRGLAPYLQNLEETCITVKTTIGRLADKGFAWRLLNQDKIKEELAAAETAISDALTIFNFGTHLSAQNLQVEIASAQKADQEELVARLDSLAYNDEKILAALQDDARRQRQGLEELIVAFTRPTQHIERITQASPAVPNDPAEAFLLIASSALQRLSGQTASGIPHWAVTSLEVRFDPGDRESCIGQGTFGNIYKGEWNGQVVAVEEMHGGDAQMLTAVSLKYIRNEITKWSQIAHPHLLPFYGACLEFGRPFIVTRFCGNGTILEFLRCKPDANRTLHEISLGMSYLHNQGVIHANLKAASVLVGDDQKAVITDFGLSRLQYQIASVTGTTGTKTVWTPHWMAPELLGGGLPDKPADVYSFAFLAWELYTGLAPFGYLHNAALAHRVLNKKELPHRPECMDDATWDMAEKCWRYEASQRPSFASIQRRLRRVLLKASSEGPENPPSAPLEYLSTTTGTEHLLRVEPAYSKLPADHEILSEESHKELHNGTLGGVNHRILRPTKSKDPAKSTREPRWFPPANSRMPPLVLSGERSAFIESVKTSAKTRMRSWERTSKALIAPVYRGKSLIDGSYSLGLGSAGARSDWGTTLPGIVLRAKAIYPYIAPLNYPNDLSFTKGEILDILDIPDSTGKWWQGRKADGNVGSTGAI